ncbi:hypothetical protein B9Z55_016634 [Caenorhabditis nigoni]|uniref:EB domain-containing protein n=1 Tax=Caenorhabditis nigoni TaxID=1611254 RepID=A0A2G5T632_9PELO|nr:hypothetical protein B9Z55_016634 [Caenorhabditis nigoni]
MKYLIILYLFVLNSEAKPPVAIGLDDDKFLQLLEVEIARTLRSELSSDDDLQNLEGSGEDSVEDDGYLKKADSLTLASITTTPEPTTTTTETTTTTTTTTTVAPTTTTVLKTTKKLAQGPPQCIVNKECYKDSECPSGKCLGSELGVCDCNACITNRKCESDVDCGGLRNACDSTGYCDCVKAFHSHGYELFVKVLLTFCHQRKCTQDTDNCYGLPCRVGKCKCAPGAKSSLPVHYFKPGGK